jgi:hypothetical protein
VLLPSPKDGAFTAAVFGARLEVPNIDGGWAPEVGWPPKRLFGAWDVAVEDWPNNEVGVEPAPNEAPGVL